MSFDRSRRWALDARGRTMRLLISYTRSRPFSLTSVRTGWRQDQRQSTWELRQLTVEQDASFVKSPTWTGRSLGLCGNCSVCCVLRVITLCVAMLSIISSWLDRAESNWAVTSTMLLLFAARSVVLFTVVNQQCINQPCESNAPHFFKLQIICAPVGICVLSISFKLLIESEQTETECA